jgi:hypothetical protein
MNRSRLQPPDSKASIFLRTVDFGPPPAGAKARVRQRLALAGVVGTGASNFASSTTVRAADHSGALRHAKPRTTVDVAPPRWWSLVAGRPLLALISGATATVGVLLFLARGNSPLAVPRTAESAVRAPSVASSPVLSRESDVTLQDEGRHGDGSRAESSFPSAKPVGSRPLPKPAAKETLQDEQRMLARARASLGRGEASLAAQDLDRHARFYPDGVLSEEREALRIVTLARQGNGAVARERAARFRRDYPRSIQLSMIDAAVAERP